VRPLARETSQAHVKSIAVLLHLDDGASRDSRVLRNATFHGVLPLKGRVRFARTHPGF
jgi:hypothetical protein